MQVSVAVGSGTARVYRLEGARSAFVTLPRVTVSDPHTRDLLRLTLTVFRVALAVLIEREDRGGRFDRHGCDQHRRSGLHRPRTRPRPDGTGAHRTRTNRTGANGARASPRLR